MFQRIFLVGVIGAIGIQSGCSVWPSRSVEKPPTSMVEERPQSKIDLTSAAKPDKTMQVTIAVTGMT